MTERELLINEIRAGLSKLEKRLPPFDPSGVATDLAPYYVAEIRAMVIREADAAGIAHFDPHCPDANREHLEKGT